MDDAKPALLRQHLERLPDVAEIDHAAAARRQDVGGEYLQRRIAGLDRLRELPGEFGRRLGVQHDVIGPVARALSDEVLVARLDRLLRRDTVPPIGKIDERRRAAEQRRAPDLLGSGRDERRAVGLDPHMMQMHVRVDAARHDDVPVASITRLADSAASVPGAAIAAMVSPATATSQRTTPCGVTTSPPRMMRSNIMPPRAEIARVVPSKGFDPRSPRSCACGK